MTVKIEFETDNAAFEDPTEAGRILRKVSVQIDAGMPSGTIRDINGNRVGKYEVR